MRSGERLRLLLRVARIIAADLPVEEILDRVADAIHELLGFPNVDLPLVDPQDPGVLVIRARGGAYKERIRHEDRLRVDQGIMGAAVTAGRTQKVDDVAADPRYVEPPAGLAMRAELAVPLVHAERPVRHEGADPQFPKLLGQILHPAAAVAVQDCGSAADLRAPARRSWSSGCGRWPSIP